MHETEWSDIARYVSGACSDEERNALEARLANDPSLADTVDAARRVWARTEPEPEPWDVPSAWRELVRKEAAMRESLSVRPLQPQDQVGPMVSWPHRGRWWAAGWAVAALAVVAFGAAFWLRGTGARATTVAIATAPMDTITTRPGQRIDLRMPDGTRVVLGVASTLRYPRNYGATRRDVYLDGQAYFEVTHDKARPFTVYAGNAVARDLGTRFDVRAYPDDDGVAVVVAEGEVELARGTDRSGAEAQRVVLTPGQLGHVSSGGAITTQAGIDVDRHLAWIDGRLVFTDAPLRDVLPILSRWYDVQFQLADSTLGTKVVTGVFEDEPLPALLQFLALSLNAIHVQQGRTITLIPNRRGR